MVGGEIMTYQLYGSQTSPFVRRIRILLENIKYEFKEVEIFEKDSVLLNKINPINQIPVLVDGERVIWDSRQIFNYLNSFHRFQNMDWDDENILTAIDGAMNSAVALLLLRRSEINIDEPLMYVQRQKDRIESILDHLAPLVREKVATAAWDIHSISLYAFFDWASFRNLIDLSKRPECLALLALHSDKPIVQATAIPKA
jgi:glutathione S-transferase